MNNKIKMICKKARLLVALSLIFYSITSLAGICINLPLSSSPDTWYGDCADCGHRYNKQLDLSYDFSPSYSDSDPYGFNSFSSNYGMELQYQEFPQFSQNFDLPYTIEQKLSIHHPNIPHTDLSYLYTTQQIKPAIPNEAPVTTEATEVNLDSQSFTNVRSNEEMEKIKKDFEEYGIELDFFQANEEDETDPDIEGFFQSDTNDSNFLELNNKWERKEDLLKERINNGPTLADQELAITEKCVVEFVKEIALDYELSPALLQDVISELRDEEFVGKNLVRLSGYYDEEDFSIEELVEVLSGKMPIRDEYGNVKFLESAEYGIEPEIFDDNEYIPANIQEIKEQIKQKRRDFIAETGELAISFIPVVGPPVAVAFSQLVKGEFDAKNLLEGFAWGAADLVGIGFLKKIKNVKKVASTAKKFVQKLGRVSVAKSKNVASKLWFFGGKNAKKISKKFEHGKLFEASLTSEAALEVGILAETKIAGKTLTLKDIAIYAVDSKAANVVGSREFLAFKNQVADLAKKQGFEKLIFRGQRSLTSTSANKGRIVDVAIDLTRR